MMIRPSRSEQAVDPFGAGLRETALYLSFEQPVMVALTVDRKAYDRGEKDSIIQGLSQFAAIVRSPAYSPLTYLQVHSREQLHRLDDAFYDDRLPGIERIELAETVLEMDSAEQKCQRYWK